MATNRLPIVEGHTQGQRTSAYRTSSSEGSEEHRLTKRCCGQCHPAVGGCLYGVRWSTSVVFLGFKRPGPEEPAGRTRTDDEGREAGSPPARWCETHQKWEREVETP